MVELGENFALMSPMRVHRYLRSFVSPLALCSALVTVSSVQAEEPSITARALAMGELLLDLDWGNPDRAQLEANIEAATGWKVAEFAVLDNVVLGDQTSTAIIALNPEEFGITIPTDPDAPLEEWDYGVGLLCNPDADSVERYRLYELSEQFLGLEATEDELFRLIELIDDPEISGQISDRQLEGALAAINPLKYWCWFGLQVTEETRITQIDHIDQIQIFAATLFADLLEFTANNTSYSDSRMRVAELLYSDEQIRESLELGLLWPFEESLDEMRSLAVKLREQPELVFQSHPAMQHETLYDSYVTTSIGRGIGLLSPLTIREENFSADFEYNMLHGCTEEELAGRYQTCTAAISFHISKAPDLAPLLAWVRANP